MSDLPLTSTVVTTYNAELYIRDTLRNLLEIDQGLPYEIVVVDDGSKDSTREICRELAKEEDRIRFYPEARIGRAKALNKAIKYANGEYIAINDADDQSCSKRLRIAIPYLEANHAVVLVSTDCIKAPEGQPYDLSRCDHAMDGRTTTRVMPLDLYRKNSITHSTVIFRKEAWRKCGGYNERLKLCIDYDFYFRMLLIGEIHHLNAVTVRHLLNRKTFFKRQSAYEFARSYFSVKSSARKMFKIPFGLYMHDIKIVFYLAKSIVSRRMRAVAI